MTTLQCCKLDLLTALDGVGTTGMPCNPAVELLNRWAYQSLHGWGQSNQALHDLLLDVMDDIEKKAGTYIEPWEVD